MRNLIELQENVDLQGLGDITEEILRGFRSSAGQL